MSRDQKTYHAGTLTYSKAGLILLFFWLLWGDFCYFMSEAVPGIIPLKLKDLHCPEFMIGVILVTIPRTFGAICNPVISFRSDRTRSRWGRRIPYIFFTMPFLVLTFFGIGYSPRLGAFLQSHLRILFQAHGFLGTLSQDTAILIVLSLFLICFDFFNSFASAVFWYLFNDVVPEELMARFMSLFRMVIMLTGILYNEFVFPRSMAHFRAVFVGAGLLYLFGFGLMCAMVREGQYPPPPENDGGRVGFIASLKTYARECLSLRHYWFQFLMGVSGTLGGACGIFNSIFQRDIMGLTLQDIGHLGVAGALGCAVYVPIAGWLADKYHPVRVYLWANILWFAVQPVNLIWLFWHASPAQYFYVMILQGFFLTWPVAMLLQGVNIPMIMRLYPRERYGQFCSCAATFSSLTGIVAGGLGGALISVLKHYFSERTSYCLIPVWSMFFTGISTWLMILLYRSWKQYGGDESYVPPLPAHLVEAAPAVLPADEYV